MKRTLTGLFEEFTKNEQASGYILLACTLLSLGIANSPLGTAYAGFWRLKFGVAAGHIHLDHSLLDWINEGLMTVFFLLVGLEMKRELTIGELSGARRASLPLFAALGGMLAPALIHFGLNRGTATQAGFGIPMATDIAFAIGLLAILGDRIPVALKVFLVALAIIDDLGSILVIAFFYSEQVSAVYVALALATFLGMILMNRLGVVHLAAYLVPGLLLWYFLQESGINATLSGVLVAFAIPFGRGDETSPSCRLQRMLHVPVPFVVMPLFALANTAIAFSGDWMGLLQSSNTLGIFFGLVLGKPAGILLFTYLAVKLGISQLPGDVAWRHIAGAGVLGGIGFTMSIFIAMLAFSDPAVAQNSKIAILMSSAIAGMAGFLFLRTQSFHNIQTEIVS